jgi:hypothetical protein
VSNEEIIQSAFYALCESQSPSLSDDRKREALGRCWDILAAGAQQRKNHNVQTQQNNWVNGEERELSK